MVLIIIRRFSFYKDDGKTSVILKTSSLSVEMPNSAGVPYKITLHTGDHRNAETSSKVYIQLVGGRTGEESSGRISLQNAELKRASIDKMMVDVPKMLSPLSHLIIGHDNSGSRPGMLPQEHVVADTRQLFIASSFSFLRFQRLVFGSR